MQDRGSRLEEPATKTRWERVMVERLRRLIQEDESGSALAEMAFIVIPLMIMMITGLVWFGLALNNDLALNNAVQAGSEQLALLRGNSADPCADTVTNVQNAAPGLDPTKLTFAITLGGTGYTTTCKVTLTSGEVETLTVSYPVSVNVFGFGAHTYTLSATTTQLIQ